MADDKAAAGGSSAAVTDGSSGGSALSDQSAADKAVADSQATTDKAAADKAAADKLAADKAAEQKYDLKLPENSTLDPAMLERIAANARARGLTNEQAQAEVDFTAQEATSAVDVVMKAHAIGGDAWKANVEKWTAETMADPSLGKTPEERKAAIDRGVTVLKRFTAARPEKAEAFKSFIETSGLGSHPAVVGLLAWLGESAGEGSHVTGGKPGEGKKTIEERWYGDAAHKDSAA